MDGSEGDAVLLVVLSGALGLPLAGFAVRENGELVGDDLDAVALTDNTGIRLVALAASLLLVGLRES